MTAVLLPVRQRPEDRWEIEADDWNEGLGRESWVDVHAGGERPERR